MSVIDKQWTERQQHYVAGQWLKGPDARLALVNPYTEKVFGYAPLGDAALVDKAVDAAQSAQTAWAALPAQARAQWLRRLLEALLPQGELISQLISREMGAPISFCRSNQARSGFAALQSYGEMATRVQRLEQIANSVVLREAAGVAGLISAWNYPFFLALGKVSPALLAGCTVVLKPSDATPLSLYLLADAAHHIGLPPGVFNLVHGTGADVGEAISGHMGIDVVSYTGSIMIGKRVMERAAVNVKRVALELGGKSAAIVLPGADLNQAVQKTVDDCMKNAGQTCIAITRLVLPRARMDEAAALAKQYAANYRLGDPSDDATTMGPLANARQYERVRAFIATGIEEGAQLVSGGLARPAGLNRGYFVQPTVFRDVDTSSTIAQQEIFGPVLSLISYDDVDHAVAIANGTVHGLNGGVYAADDTQALAVARRMRCGKVDINGGLFNLNAPAGGVKQSGIGRERGPHAIDEYMEMKSLQFTTPEAASDYIQQQAVAE